MNWSELVDLQIELNRSDSDLASTAVQEAVRSRMCVLDGEPGVHERHLRRRHSLRRWADNPPRTERQAAEARLLARLPVLEDDPPSWEL